MMPRKLTRTLGDYMASGGWSSSKFFEQAKTLFNDPDLLKIGEFEFGRTVVYYSTGRHVFKFYVHHKGRSDEYLSVVDGITKEELVVFHCDDSAAKIKDKLFLLFKREPHP